jgi:hypothetical protein
MTKTQTIPAPPWMKRREKAEFLRVVQARFDLGNPVKPAELDTICDYVACRLRLRKLEEFAAKAHFQHEHIALARSIEAATGTSRRLAKDLGLILPPTSKRKTTDE